MQEQIKVAVDAMGGDYAPSKIIEGVMEAIFERKELKVALVGPQEQINQALQKFQYCKEQLEVVPATEIITNEEAPVMAIRKKKDSSIVVGLQLLKNKKVDAFLSAGSTGAILVGGQLLVGRMKGVERAPLAPVIPTKTGGALLIDCGANVDARASHLLQFAKMGSLYMKYMRKQEKPRVAIVNIGAEEEKGNALVKETYPLLKNCEDIHFIGSIEARDIPAGAADVIVCEAFVGNVILKLYEGVGSIFMQSLKEGLKSTVLSKLGALFIQKPLKQVLRPFDTRQYGAAPLLGLNGLVLKAHGNSGKEEIKQGIFQCMEFKKEQLQEKMQRFFA